MEKLVKEQTTILLSIIFTILLLGARLLYSGTAMYIFFVWNMFLALVPYLVSRHILHQKKFGLKTITLLLLWLLFLPNAPYIITDIFHFKHRPPVPQWFDLVLVFAAAWTGLLCGLLSLRNVESFLLRQLKPGWTNVVLILCIGLCSYGIFLGRYLRFNSWDVVTNPLPIVQALSSHFLNPFQHANLWGFTLLYTALLVMVWLAQKSISMSGPGNWKISRVD